MVQSASGQSTGQLLQLALQQHQAGHIPQAEALYRQVLEQEPGHADALHLLGALNHQQGDDATAAELISQAIRIDPARHLFHYNLGTVFQALGRQDEAAACFSKAIELKPGLAEACFNLGAIYQERGNAADAIHCFRQALESKPDYARAQNSLVRALQEQGDLQGVAEIYRNAVLRKPDLGDSHYRLGLALADLGKQDEAIACFNHARLLDPGSVDVLNSLANMLKDQGRTEEAVQHYRQALELQPGLAGLHTNLGNAYKQQDKLDAAIESYRKAVALEPGFAGAHNNLGVALQAQGRQDEAIQHFRQALALMPDYAEARWNCAMAHIPLVAATTGEIAASRLALQDAVSALDAWFVADRMAHGHEAVGASQPFYLAYQEQDNRELLQQYGQLCVRLMKHWQDRQGLPAPRARASDKASIRVGIVSAHICSHPVWDAIVKGWFRHLDPKRIELHVFHLGAKQDEETKWARSRCCSYLQGAGALKQWVDAISGRQVDVLLYPEIGMDPMTIKLASLRLAPLQVATWGHPETTGLPTIDHYLSAEYLEPELAQGHYTERLERLPNLGCCYLPPRVVSTRPDLAGLGIERGQPLLLCPGTPFKYAPQHDHVLAAIARSLGQCQLVFFNYKFSGLTANLRQRLARAFADAGMEFNDYCRFIPWQDKAAFYGLMQQADVFLDTIGFSGFNTAMQSIECGLPVVAREGRFMRGRLASGILKRIGMPELVADSAADYIERVTRLAQDAAYRQQVKSRIEAARSVLYDDVSPIRALEDFLCGSGKDSESGQARMQARR